MKIIRDQWGLLGGARFVLSAIVLLGHAEIFFPAYKHIWIHVGTWLNETSAVYGFLVISGYSIAASLDRSRRGFFVRRLRRIYPTYLAALFLAVVTSAFLVSPLSVGGVRFNRPSATDILLALVMLQTFLGPAIAIAGQLWTIAVEWWNYMLAPIYRRVPTWALLIILAASLFAERWWPAPPDPAATYGGHMFAILSWYWIVGFLYYRHRRTAFGYVVLFLPVYVSLALLADGKYLTVSAFMSQKADVIALVAVALCENVSIPKVALWVLEWLGELSYPLYAVQGPVMVMALILGLRSAVVVIAMSMIAGVAILHLVDLPLRRYSRETSSIKQALPASARP